MERGVLVPDGVTIDMVMEWVGKQRDAAGFLLDGFPRTLAQAEALEQAMAEDGGVDRALNISVSREELVRRLGGRLICRSCQTPYHLYSSPPAQPGTCDRCGGELYQRDDDKPKAVEKRMQVYLDETEPLAGYYRQAGILRDVDGERPIEEVTKDLLNALR
jgi:adenylate kinase